MKILYLITARGGSKGIPGKNIKPLGGRPLIDWSIQGALKAGAPAEDLIVSTDSDEIGEIARRCGASVPFMRPAELASDTAGSREVMLHAVDTLAESGRVYDTICLLQPTSPFRSAKDIRRAIELHELRRPEMTVSVMRSPANPYYNLFEPDAEGMLHISKGSGRYTRRQDAPPVYEFNGAVYVIDVEALRRENITRFASILPYEMPADRSIDLDTPADWERAEERLRCGIIEIE